MNLKRFYSDKKRLSYNPRNNILGYKIRNRIIAFDDRFVTVKNKLNAIVNESNQNKIRFLDIGIGDGVYESLLEKQVLDKLYICGIDISKVQINRAKKYIKEGKIIDLNSQIIPYKDNSFDLILISEILEHIFYPDKALEEASRLLKPGGKLVLTFPNSGSLQLRLSLLLFGSSPLLNYPENTEHLRYFNKRGILRMLGQDFEILTYEGLGSLLFSKWNFQTRIIMPRILQILSNKLLPGYALGNLLVLGK